MRFSLFSLSSVFTVLALLAGAGASAVPFAGEGLVSRAGKGFMSVVYFCDWAVYQRNHHPSSLPNTQITHLLYAFADIHPTGEVYLNNTQVAFRRPYPDDPKIPNNATAAGAINQIFKLKQQNRNLKVMLSIGGWTYSPHFVGPASSESGRKLFARSAVKLMGDLGFDGVDVDWEYPKTPEQSQNLVDLLRETRLALNTYSATHSPGKHFLLSVASPAGPINYNRMQLKAMDSLLDFWNLMAYDYSGQWDKHSGHDANLFPSKDLKITPFSTEKAINDYLAAGVPAVKINLGMPIYGRGFRGTDGPGGKYQSLPEGDWERGIYDYKSLPLPGAKVETDMGLLASWSYDPVKREMISFDTVEVVRAKAEYIKRRGLGGGMWWESSGDRTGEESLVGTLVQSLGGVGALERSENTIAYPGSRFVNFRGN